MKTTAAFPEPNHTQTPNDFFKMIPDMEDSELRVTLVMIRQTFGFHRESFKMGLLKLAAAAGLSRQGALDGAKSAEGRGTFRRVNPEESKEAEWELIVHPLYSVEGVNPVEGSPQMGRGQSGVKESIKEINDDDNKAFGEIMKLYEENIGPITGIISAKLGAEFDQYKNEPDGLNWLPWAIEIAATKNIHDFDYIKVCLKNRKQHGKNWKPQQSNGGRYAGRKTGNTQRDEQPQPRPAGTPADDERAARINKRRAERKAQMQPV